jgi:hypothetical protein
VRLLQQHKGYRQKFGKRLASCSREGCDDASSFCFDWNCFLSSCGIGGFWMNGNPHMEPTQPYVAHWIKDGMTKESRRFDFVECGGGIDLGDGYEVQSSQSKSTQEIFDGLNTHVHRVLTCMKSNGISPSL